MSIAELLKLQGTDYDERLPESIHWDGEWLDIIHGGINTTYSSYKTKKADHHVPTLEGVMCATEAVFVVCAWWRSEPYKEESAEAMKEFRAMLDAWLPKVEPES